MTLYTAAVTLILLMDPLGNIPVFITILNTVESKRRKWLILRESCFAFIALTVFLFFGEKILDGLNISEAALSISGGIILFLISIKMIFPYNGEQMQRERQVGEPFIVPLAIPLLAGPSAMGMVLLFATQYPTQKILLLAAILIASFSCMLVLLFANLLKRFLGQKGLIAIERLMGMLLTTVAVQMFLTGLQHYLITQ